jgi:predicted enzyme related to lactoylglutathione lyase
MDPFRFCYADPAMENPSIRRICQVEIRVTNLARAVHFYRGCFDWQIHVMNEEYAIIDTGIEPVGALMVTPSPHWPPGVGNYALVPDCEAAARLVAERGGKIFIAKTETGGGAYTGVIDPFGTELLFWQPARDFAPKLSGSGRHPIVWLELPAPDLAQGMAFYRDLLGWRFNTIEEQVDYAVTMDGGFRLGISLVGGERGGRMRGVTNYIATSDLAATATRVLLQGGRIVRERTVIPGEGTFLLFQDPDGIRWGAFQAGTP